MADEPSSRKYHWKAQVFYSESRAVRWCGSDGDCNLMGDSVCLGVRKLKLRKVAHPYRPFYLLETVTKPVVLTKATLAADLKANTL